MKRLSFLVGGLALAAVLLALQSAGDPAAARDDRVISVLGVAAADGHKAFVHITLAVKAGQDVNRIADEALAAQGARRPNAADFSLTGFKWPQFASDGSTASVVQFYNTANQPANGRQALTASQATWNDVAESNFVLQDGGNTTRCPSLVRECSGPQVYDGKNDVGWMAISGCCTLGVTWFGTGPGGQEADMALNTRFNWVTTYDPQTVFLHENGHVAGLGHSAVTEAVMYASYHGQLQSLTCDDKLGLWELYPEGPAPQCESGSPPTATPTVAAPTATPTATAADPGATPTATPCPPGWIRQQRPGC